MQYVLCVRHGAAFKCGRLWLSGGQLEPNACRPWDAFADEELRQVSASLNAHMLGI